MAVGFAPAHTENVALHELTREQYLVIALATAERVGWQVTYVSGSGLMARTNNGMFSWNAELTIKLESGQAIVKSASAGNEVMDLDRNKKNVRKFTAAFEEVKPTLTPDELAKTYQLISQKFDSPELDVLQVPPQTTREKTADFLAIFRPVRGYVVTPLLLISNLLIFGLMALTGVSVLSPTTVDLLAWGANYKPLTLDGEWWRLLTCCFLHIGLLHSLFNVFALVYVGTLLEPVLGSERFGVAYLLTGIVASLTSLWWYDVTVSAGASGAIFGMYGVFLALLTTSLIEKETRQALLVSIALFVGYNLLNDLKSGIDTAAHLGGLLSGLLIGYAFVPGLRTPEAAHPKLVGIGLVSAVVLAAAWVVYTVLPNDMAVYSRKMDEFASTEEMALGVYHMTDTATKEEVLYELKTRGLFYWEKNLAVVSEAGKLDLPEDVAQRNEKLKTYCQLRIKSYALMYKAVEKNTKQYVDQITHYDRQILTLMNEIRPKE